MRPNFRKKCLRAIFEHLLTEQKCRRCVRRDRVIRRVLEIDDPCDERMRRDEDEMTRDLARTPDGRPR